MSTAKDRPLRFVLILEGTWHIDPSEEGPTGCTIEALFAHDVGGRFEEVSTTFLVPLPIRHLGAPVRWGQTQLTEAARQYLTRKPGETNDGHKEDDEEGSSEEDGEEGAEGDW